MYSVIYYCNIYRILCVCIFELYGILEIYLVTERINHIYIMAIKVIVFICI